jgi:transposase-like protein
LPNPPITEADRLRIIELADEGLSVRAIAKELDLAPSTVTRNAKRMGLVFDRAATIAATTARLEDARARRSVAAEQALNDALGELGKLHQPCRVVGVVGGMNAGVHSKVLPRPPAAERVSIVKNVSTLIDVHLKLAQADMTNNSTDYAKSMLGKLMNQLDDLSAVDGWLETMAPTEEAGEPAP